jgi:hypothetical protein
MDHCLFHHISLLLGAFVESLIYIFVLLLVFGCSLLLTSIKLHLCFFTNLSMVFDSRHLSVTYASKI